MQGSTGADSCAGNCDPVLLAGPLKDIYLCDFEEVQRWASCVSSSAAVLAS